MMKIGLRTAGLEFLYEGSVKRPSTISLFPHAYPKPFFELRGNGISAEQMKLPAERDEKTVVDEHQ